MNKTLISVQLPWTSFDIVIEGKLGLTGLTIYLINHRGQVDLDFFFSYKMRNSFQKNWDIISSMKATPKFTLLSCLFLVFPHIWSLSFGLTFVSSLVDTISGGGMRIGSFIQLVGLFEINIQRMWWWDCIICMEPHYVCVLLIRS